MSGTQFQGQLQPQPQPQPQPAVNQPTLQPAQPAPQPSYEELMAFYNNSTQSAVATQPQQPVHSATQHIQQPEMVKQYQEPVVDFSDSSCTSITLKLDGESLKILMDANEIFRETIVNMGIKLASQTPIYKDFFRFKDLRVTSGSIGTVTAPVTDSIIGTVTTAASVAAPVVVPNTAASVGAAPAKKKSTGFATWG